MRIKVYKTQDSDDFWDETGAPLCLSSSYTFENWSFSREARVAAVKHSYRVGCKVYC